MKRILFATILMVVFLASCASPAKVTEQKNEEPETVTAEATYEETSADADEQIIVVPDEPEEILPDVPVQEIPEIYVEPTVPETIPETVPETEPRPTPVMAEQVIRTYSFNGIDIRFTAGRGLAEITVSGNAALTDVVGLLKKTGAADPEVGRNVTIDVSDGKIYLHYPESWGVDEYNRFEGTFVSFFVEWAEDLRFTEVVPSGSQVETTGQSVAQNAVVPTRDDVPVMDFNDENTCEPVFTDYGTSEIIDFEELGAEDDGSFTWLDGNIPEEHAGETAGEFGETGVREVAEVERTVDEIEKTGKDVSDKVAEFLTTKTGNVVLWIVVILLIVFSLMSGIIVRNKKNKKKNDKK